MGIKLLLWIIAVTHQLAFTMAIMEELSPGKLLLYETRTFPYTYRYTQKPLLYALFSISDLLNFIFPQQRERMQKKNV